MKIRIEITPDRDDFEELAFVETLHDDATASQCVSAVTRALTLAGYGTEAIRNAYDEEGFELIESIQASYNLMSKRVDINGNT